MDRTLPSSFSPQAPPPGVRVPQSRWRQSQTSFGPVGRIIATLLLLLPLAVFVFAAGMFLIGGFIYVFVVLPWGLRDIWRKTSVRSD